MNWDAFWKMDYLLYILLPALIGSPFVFYFFKNWLETQRRFRVRFAAIEPKSNDYARLAISIKNLNFKGIKTVRSFYITGDFRDHNRSTGFGGKGKDYLRLLIGGKDSDISVLPRRTVHVDTEGTSICGHLLPDIEVDRKSYTLSIIDEMDRRQSFKIWLQPAKLWTCQPYSVYDYMIKRPCP